MLQPAEDALWQRFQMLLAVTRAYGKPLPAPTERFPPPSRDSAWRDFLFCATATEEEYQAKLNEEREDMLQWKAQVNPSRKFSNIKVNI